MKKTSLTTITCAALAFLLTSSADARWAIRPQEVPVDRLLDNTRTYIETHPHQMQGYYVLGRLHSMAFATNKNQVSVARPRNPNPKEERSLPSFLPYHSVKVKPSTGDVSTLKVSAEQLVHLEASIRNYRKACELARQNSKKKARDKKGDKTKDEPRALLGLAWMLEVASQNRDAIETAARSEAIKKIDADVRQAIETFVKQSSQWKSQSVEAYQAAFKATSTADEKRRISGPGADSLISLDAARSIIRILNEDQPTIAQKKLVTRMKQYIKDLGRVGRMVTPIIFSLRSTDSLADHLQPGKAVKFDLDGDGVASRWPWLRGDTCLLVWDPERTGKVSDGRQLFGSVTWWIYWDHGYQPLAALDNDHDGWLSGSELRGLSVWRDRNSNGRSDEGEVVTVASMGIRRIAARPNSNHDDVPGHTAGIELHSGRTVPTYDWSPVSLP